jgi:NADH-quinone oxidoreductase subunit A
MTPTAAYLLLFLAVGIGFIFVHLMAGKFIRPNTPSASKGTIYECGEPTIGSAWIQFDLRFYVIALLFVIFDVEVAFFFPWAEVFGKANAVAALPQPTTAAMYNEMAELGGPLVAPGDANAQITYEQMKSLKQKDLDRMREKRAKSAPGQLQREDMDQVALLYRIEDQSAKTIQRAGYLAWIALAEILVFFGVLLVGFAYLWRRGDLAWVRSLAAERASGEPSVLPLAPSIHPSAPLVGAGTHS